MGKSRLARHLICEHNAILLSNQVKDMAELFDDHDIAIFDIPRTDADKAEHMYSFAEKLKNGMFVRPKFKSALKMFKPPHVIFFANFVVADDVWSRDRLKIIDLNCPDVHVRR